MSRSKVMFTVLITQVVDKGFNITPDQYVALIERLTRIETLLSNHLQSAQAFTEKLMYPVIIGVVLLLVKSFWSDVRRIVGKK
jgi:hypothetical protein